MISVITVIVVVVILVVRVVACGGSFLFFLVVVVVAPISTDGAPSSKTKRGWMQIQIKILQQLLF